MKKIKNFALFVLAVAFLSFNFNCGPDGGPVTITLNPADTTLTLAQGDEYQVQVTLTPDATNGGKVGHFRILVNGDAKVDTTYDSESSITYDFSYTIPADAEVGSSYTIVFEATDPVSNDISTKDVVISVEQSIPSVKSETVQMTFISTDYANSEMIAQLNSDQVTLGGKDLDGQITYIYQGSDYGNCILSPNNRYPDVYGDYNNQTYDYANKQQTIFVLDNSIDFDNLTDQQINELTINEADAGKVGNYGYGYDNVPVGSILKFKTADGRKGVLKVTEESSPNPGKGDNTLTATIKFDVKYQVSSAAATK